MIAILPPLEHMQWLLAALIGVGLAASCGFRVFVPLFIASLALRLEFLPAAMVTPAYAEWLGSPFAVITLGLATFVELLAYKIPFVDNVLDAVAAPLAVIAGTVLSASFLTGVDDPLLKLSLGLIAGGMSAGVIHAGTSLVRLGSTKTTAGLANPIFAVFEAIFAIIGSILSIALPLIAALGALILVIAIGLMFGRARKFFRPPPPPAPLG